MKIVQYPDSDAVYVQLRDTQYGGGRQLDDSRHLDLDLEGDVLGILFLYTSDGVNLENIPNIPPTDFDLITKQFEAEGIWTKSPA